VTGELHFPCKYLGKIDYRSKECSVSHNGQLDKQHRTMSLGGVHGASFISILADQTDLTEKVVRDGYWRASGSALVKKTLLGENLSLC